ncbi:flagellar basal-body rod protein FlgF [Litoreibacter ponti]|uniref:Flagellar basal-body rod protein FlgF n=1 Tax=Litoreibacter ponti TaxID=1510457 RepID=A0A2T6BNF5_9RHOB|nr:flagellar hook-basal body complex protein [Litoreibacter ponti]PTX57574.1 flagellar basal-body rod protein FlgF [Litoreibacter ponti]
MSNSVYTAITRQSGLMAEMRVIANNVANMATTGFRSEQAIFSEHVKTLGENHPSLSMANAKGRMTSFEQGVTTQTGGTFDLAINGEGFFQIETPAGTRLSRAGAFMPNEAGELVTPEGYRLLDAGGAPVFAPSDVGPIAISPDGTMSANGAPFAQISLVVPLDYAGLTREDGVRFNSASETIPAETATVSQGFLESSNVDAVSQISRMIEVQRSYEMGQSFLEKEDERLRSIMTLVGRR